MGFLNKIFGRPDPSSVMKMSGPPTAFMSNISRRKFWKKIPLRLLDAIARNAGEVFRDFTDNHVRIGNEMQLLIQQKKCGFGISGLPVGFCASAHKNVRRTFPRMSWDVQYC